MSSILRKALIIHLLSLILSLGLFAQAPKLKSQEISETDGLPVLIGHLPDAENHKSTAVFATGPGELEAALGQRPVLEQIDFTGGTEAVTASYDAGKLLIIEYSSPQASSAADLIFAQAIDNSTVYRRIGNYNAFVFDVTDHEAANALLDQVKYEKQIHWLGKDPFRISAERAFVTTTANLFFSTLLVIVLGVGISLVGGLVAGFTYFQLRERRRAAMTAYTDAGGMTRLNLDGFTPDRLLGD